jgi:hypothetical protein
MNPQNWVILASSEGLSATFEKGVSVTANPPPGAAWSVVPQARRPETRFAAETLEASQVPVVATNIVVIRHLEGARWLYEMRAAFDEPEKLPQAPANFQLGACRASR